MDFYIIKSILTSADILIEKFEGTIRKMFIERLNPNVCYHKLVHTLSIVEKSIEIGEFYGLEQSLARLSYNRLIGEAL